MKNENSDYVKVKILAGSKLNSIESKAVEESGNSQE